MRGSWRAKVRDDEPEYAPVLPNPPTWLTREARAEWKRVVPHLESAGLVAEVDRSMLSAYCEAWSEFVSAEGVLRREGKTFTTEKGYVMQHPFVAIRNKARDDVRRFAQEFGFSPSSRVRVTAPGSSERDDGTGKERFISRAS